MPSSIVVELQRSALDPKRSVAELLRMVKVIAAKLDLSDITSWVDCELGGYEGAAETVPPYRQVRSGAFQILHPYHGWRPAGHLDIKFPCGQSVSELERLASSESVVISLSGKEKLPVRDEHGLGIQNWLQQMQISPTELTRILDAVRTKILDWSLELEKRGIMGDNMSFNEAERKSAQNKNFTIQNFTGVLGDVSQAHVEIHNYSSIHQTLRDQNIPQAERNEIESIIDDLKKADESQRPRLLERAKGWIVKNQDFLGASVTLIRKACGIPESE